MSNLRLTICVFLFVLHVSAAISAEDKIGNSSINGGGCTPLAGQDIKLYGSVGQAISGASAGLRVSQFSGFWTPWLQGVVTDVAPTAQAIFALAQNFPNPFNPSTTIRYSLGERSRILIAIFNVAGQRVTLLRDAVEEAGEHSAQWNGKDARGASVSSGIYFLEMRAGGFVAHRKMILLR